MLTNLIDRLWSMLGPYELPDDAELLGGTIIDWCVAKEF